MIGLGADRLSGDLVGVMVPEPVDGQLASHTYAA
jgi:hypothetical protein